MNIVSVISESDQSSIKVAGTDLIMVTHDSFSTSSPDSRLIVYRDDANDFHVHMYAVEGVMRVSADTAFGLEDLTVANTAGIPHTYGWELNLVSKRVDYFFDGVRVAPNREANFTADNGDEHHFGDATGGETHRDIYERFSIQEAPFSGVPGTDGTWTTDGSGVWISPVNWSIDPAPNSSSHTAVFANAISVPTTVVVDTDVTVHAITFDHSVRYVVAGAGSVNLISETNGPFPRVTVAQGHHEFQSDVNLHYDTQVDIQSGALLEFNNELNLGAYQLTKLGDGTLAINNNLNAGTGGAIDCVQGTCSGSGTVGGDLNNTSGTISPGNSLVALADHGNFNGGEAGQVPEPTAWLLLVLGVLAGCLGRPR